MLEASAASMARLRVAILFHRFGPYHHARLKAAGLRMRVTGVEFTNVDMRYAWDLVQEAKGFDKVTLFPAEAVDELPGSRIFSRVSEVFSQIRPQVVVIAGWYDRCNLAALRWCESEGIPVVVMSETTAWDDRRRWWREWVKRRLVKMCAAGLVGGRAHALYLEGLGVDRNRIYLGYDAVDNGYFEEKAKEVREQKSAGIGQKGLPENFFLASARFVQKKNLSRLIQAYAMYRQKSQDMDQRSQPWDLVIMGDGPLRAVLASQISDLSLNGHVWLPGFKQYGELPVYYGLAKAFIHASTTEQWGLVVNEAMASGLPVLVSNRCGCAPDLVREGRNGFSFDPCNVETLAQLMSKLSAPDFPLSTFGAESQRIVSQCSPEVFAQNMESACACAITSRLSKPSRLARGVTNLLIRIPENLFRSNLEIAERSSSQATALLPALTVVPNFFIIGAPKSGTTALSEYLKSHPNIYFSAVKEPHFFDLDTSKRFKLSLRTYLSLFSKADPDRHKAVGEGSTGYLFSTVAVSEILKFNPNARFIVMLRNPVELVHAWHSEKYFEGVENVQDFEKAWRLEEERQLGRNIPPHCWEPRTLFYSEWGKLGDQIERLFSVADRDKVKVILFDDFVGNTKSVYEEVLSFLGVPSDGRTSFPPIHENRTLRQPWLQRKLAFSANHFRGLRAATGLKLALGLGWSQKLLLLNSKPTRRPPIDPVLRAELEDFYREDIKTLSKLLDRDLSGWMGESRERGAETRGPRADHRKVEIRKG